MTFSAQSRYRLFIVVVSLLALAGCGRGHEMGLAYNAADTRYADEVLPAGKAESKPAAPSGYMAYEHTVSLDVKGERVQPVYEAALAACRDAAADQCAVLESRLDTGSNPFARLRLRAKAAGIKKILAALAQQGGVISQSTSAEDLAQPIADTSKKLEMLRDYRTKLEGLRGRASSNIESLMKVNKELAQVQSDIEALTGEHAHLMQRVETEILNIDIASTSDKPFWTPIGRSLSNFGYNLSDALSGVITAIAYIIPWAPILFVLAWLTRKLWMRTKRSRAGH